MEREIPNWPGYWATPEGQILSSKVGPALIRRKVRPDRNGYHQVDLRQSGHRETVLVHRLVLETFVGPRPPGMQCRHLNGDQTDNRLWNLEWATPRENCEDVFRMGRRRRASDRFRRFHRGRVPERASSQTTAAYLIAAARAARSLGGHPAAIARAIGRHESTVRDLTRDLACDLRKHNGWWLRASRA
jgi:hypothetical protein